MPVPLVSENRDAVRPFVSFNGPNNCQLGKVHDRDCPVSRRVDNRRLPVWRDAHVKRKVSDFELRPRRQSGNVELLYEAVLPSLLPGYLIPEGDIELLSVGGERERAWGLIESYLLHDFVFTGIDDKQVVPFLVASENIFPIGSGDNAFRAGRSGYPR